MSDNATAGMNPAPSFRRRHWEMLAFSVVALLLAFILQIREDGRVAFPGLHEHPLPESCVSKSVFGVSCPGCGMTRSFVSLAHGQWHDAWSYHRLGALIFLAAVIQIPYRLACVYALRRPRLFESAVVRKSIGWTLIFLLVGNWCLEMILTRGS